jgi:Ser/Thr protein kinase RdoA (MazF antagonist)
MPLFEKTIPVDRDAVAALVAQAWPGLALDGIIKASQNHTFAAHDEASGAKYSVRVTPDPTGAHYGRTQDELAFVSFLATQLDGVCAPVPLRDSSERTCLQHGQLVVCVFTWAVGEPVNFPAYKWLTDEAIVHEWGAWLARLHAASRAFTKAQPEVAARMRRWDQLHDNLMQGVPLHPDDAAAAAAAAAGEPGTERHYGVIHGDVNLSNFFIRSEPGQPPALSVFDWDQAQLGWWEYDLAQPAITSLMLAEGGSLPAGDPVPEANPAQWQRWLIAGYEREAGVGSVDRPRFDRMLALRKSFYGRFATRAIAEGDIPPEMGWFLEYIDKWVNKCGRAAAAASAAGGVGSGSVAGAP